MPRTETYTLNMGPQHPSTHGVLQVQLELDGERIVKATPVMGYLHRGIEKLLESRTYTQCAPYTDRLDYVSSMNNNFGYARAVEELAGIETSRRAEYIRVIMAELCRINSHLVFIGTLANDLGASTGMLYCFRDREKILDIFNLVCGARQTFHYIRIGGVKGDLSAEAISMIQDFLRGVPAFLAEYDRLLSGNEIFRHRLIGVSAMTREEALAFHMTGPNLRATGLAFDIRKVDGYSVYDEFDFAVPVGRHGDNWDRYQVKIQEIAASANIIQQAIEGLPEGATMAKVPKILKPPKGEVFSRTEGTRGELGFYIVSDGTPKPYRIHIRRPSFVNMQGLGAMCRGMLIGDAVGAYSSIDPIMGEVDC